MTHVPELTMATWPPCPGSAHFLSFDQPTWETAVRRERIALTDCTSDKKKNTLLEGTQKASVMWAG